MSYVDMTLAALCCALFAAAAFAVQRRLRSATAQPVGSAARTHEEDLVRPVRAADGEPGWAMQDELPWHEVVEQPPTRDLPTRWAG